jgi:hypothetical protein
MVAALVAWLAVRLAVEYLLRPRLQAPLTLRHTCAHGCSLNVGITSVPPETGHIGDWVLRATGPGNQIMTTYQPPGGRSARRRVGPAAARRRW